MKNIERSIYIIIIVIIVGVLSCGITYIVMKDKDSTKVQDDLKGNNKTEEKKDDNSPTNNFKVKTFIANSKEHIKLLTNDKYEITKSDGTKIEGKYLEVNDQIIFDNTIAYKKGSYLLIKDTEYEIYNMYYDSDKYANFIKDITSANIYDYLTNDWSEELKSQINKIEIDTINYCFKSSLDEENFSCLTDYNIYLKDYDYNKCSYYEGSELYLDIFAGSSPECKKDYLLKENFFEFKKLKNKYVIQNSFTGI